MKYKLSEHTVEREIVGEKIVIAQDDSGNIVSAQFRGIRQYYWKRLAEGADVDSIAGVVHIFQPDKDLTEIRNDVISFAKVLCEKGFLTETK